MAIKKDDAKQKNKQASNKTVRKLKAKAGKTGVINMADRKRKAENNAYLASFPEMNTNPILELDRQGNVIYLNPAGKRLFPDLTELGLNHPLLADWAQVMKKLDATDVVQPVIHIVAVGDLFYEQAYFTAAENRIRIYGRDITKRKIAEDTSLLRNEMLDACSDALLWTDSNGNFIYVNEAACKAYGYTREEIMKTNFSKLIVPEYAPLVQPITVETLKKRDTIFETAHYRKDGSILPVEIHARVFKWKGGEHVLSVCRDITERKKTEAALKESEEKYRLIVDNSHDIIFTLDAEGKFLYISPSINKVLGYNQTDLIGHRFQSIVHPDDVAIVMESIQRLFKDGYNIPGGIEFRVRHISGEWRWHNAIGSTAFDANGKFLNFVGVVRDVTERKQAEYREKKHLEKLSLLNTATYHLNTIENPEEIATYVCSKVKEIIGTGYVLVSLLDETTQTVSVKAIEGILNQKLINNVIHLFGADPRSMKIAIKDMTTEELNSFHSGKLGLLEGGIYDLLTRKYPKAVCNMLGHMMDVRFVYAIGFIYRNRFFGGVTIMTNTEKDVEENKDFIETLANQSATFLSRTKANVALKASEENFRNSLDNSLVGIRISDIENRTLYVNQSFMDIFGYKNIDEVSARSPQKYYTSECYSEYLDMREKYGRGEIIPDQVDIDIVRNDGTIRYLQALFKVILWDGKQQYQTLYNDITERKRAELQIREQKAFTDRILESTTNAVMVVGKDRRIIMVNKAFEDTFALAKSKIEGKGIGEIIPIFRMVDTISEVLANGKSQFQVEFRIKRGAIERILVTDIISMQQNEVLVILRDITDERAMQERLYLTDRLASVGEMAAGVAHELNNPLTGVVALSQLLLDSGVPDEMKKDLETISKEGQRAASIVRNLLSFARSHTLSLQPTEINALIMEVLSLRAYEHKVNNIEVTTYLAPNLPEILIDRFQIQQVFLNLILNAEQAMIESNGRGNLTIITEHLNGLIRISFTDDGPGIPPEIMNRIFDPFFTTKEVGKGTGLGLSICYGIVTNQGGKIYAQSEEGKGATFTVELPINAHQ